MPPLNGGNHEIEVSSRGDNKHEERDVVGPSTRTSSSADILNNLCRLQVRCEDLEQDRNYHAVKANELQETLEAYSSDDIQETLMKKSMQIAEASMDIDRLHYHIRKLEAEINKLKVERETERVNMMDLSSIVRFLQSSCKVSDEEEEEDEDEEEALLTPEKGLDMTLKNMKFQIEFLQDERQKMARKCMSQANTIEILKRDSELEEVKIGILEELFRSLNSEERGTSCQAHQETTAVTKAVLTTSEKGAEVVSSSKCTSIEPKSARRMEIKIGGLEGQYNGPLWNSLPHGTGIIRFRNGDTYLGELVDGEMHGNGTLYHRSKDSGIARGHFEHNVFMGVEKEAPPFARSTE
jgi:hypothetical protein